MSSFRPFPDEGKDRAPGNIEVLTSQGFLVGSITNGELWGRLTVVCSDVTNYSLLGYGVVTSVAVEKVHFVKNGVTRNVYQPRENRL
jgi:hypothetical protein